MEKQSPVQRIWELGKDEHGKLITAVILAVVGVVCGMVPYFAAAKMIALLLAGERALGVYTGWLIAALCGFLARTALYNGALGISHKATYGILKTTTPARHSDGYVQRQAQADHRRSGGRHGDDARASLPGDDRKHRCARADADISLRSGLAAGAFVAGRVPGRVLLHDDGHGRVLQGLGGRSAGDERDEQRHDRIHKRH